MSFRGTQHHHCMDFETFKEHFYKDFPEYSSLPVDVLKEALNDYGQQACPECASTRGDMHSRYSDCKNLEVYDSDNDKHINIAEIPENSDKRYMKRDDWKYGEFWIKYYRWPYEYKYLINTELDKYREEPLYPCKVCGEPGSRGGYCEEHQKKLDYRLQKSRRMVREGEELARLEELRMLTYETNKLSNKIEKRR